MFLWRRMPIRARSFCKIFLSVIPDFMMCSEKEPSYDDMVAEIEGVAREDIKKEYPNIREITASEITKTKNVIAVRCFAGKDEDFYTIYGYEAYFKKDKKGSKWLMTASDNDKKSITIRSDEGKIPKLKIWYCGCCGDVNVLTKIDHSKVFYVTFD